DRRNPGEQCPGQFNRRDLLAGDQPGGLGDGQEGLDAALHRRRTAGRRALALGLARARLLAAAPLPLPDGFDAVFAAFRPAGLGDPAAALAGGRTAGLETGPDFAVAWAAGAAASGGVSRKLLAISSANGRSWGMDAIRPATCRHASTRSAICPGFSTRPDREISICISAGLIVGTGVAGDAAIRSTRTSVTIIAATLNGGLISGNPRRRIFWPE